MSFSGFNTSNIDIQMWIDIGELIATRKRRIDLNFHFEELKKKTFITLNQSKIESLNYGHFEDCGDFYQEQVVANQSKIYGISDGLGEQVKRISKYEKKLRHAFEEKYPEQLDILEEHIKQADVDIYTYLLSKTKDQVLYAQRKKSWNL